MKREELIKKLSEIGIGANHYSLYGSLEPDRIVLYQNYSKWEVFYFSERGTREDFHVFPSEDLACQYIFNMLRDEMLFWKKIEEEKKKRKSCENQ
ncbi:hypothetical protein SAMN02910409_0417 [Prevotellaceae bacterium HUN156]|nr:hypothetical protein SAMN02910409_0417 [Prevotellaceae bacterium HUN156]